jgi:hypothetical protein
MSDILSSARAASRAIAKMSGKRNGRTDSDQRGIRWADVVAVNGKFADVMMDGTVHSPLRYTRECEGMAEGDRVIVQYMGREPVIVGVMSVGYPRVVKIAKGINLSVSGKMCVVSVDYLNVTQAHTTLDVGTLPEWCVPYPSGLNPDGMWIGYMFTRGAESYGQVMALTDGRVQVHSSVTGAFHSGQVFFMMK